MKITNGKVYYSFFEKCWNKFRHSKLYNNSFTCACRRKKLNNTNFSIISNNCWGGICYEYFGLQKTSPTVGCYFFSGDYIKFISNLHYYVNQKLHIIPVEESAHYDSLKKKNELTVPIGRLDDIEIVFLHYKNPLETVEKWNRRLARINWNNLIVKYSNMNEPSEEDINSFINTEIPNAKKLLFLNKDYTNKMYTRGGVIFHEFKNEDTLLDDTLYWKKHFNIYEFINSPPNKERKMKVLQIIDVYKHGGAEKVFDAYRKFCKNEGIEIKSVSLYKSENESLAFLQETNAHGIAGKVFQQIRALSAFRKIVRQDGIEKIVSFLDRSNILSIMAVGRKIPVVATVHNPPTVQYQKLGKLKRGVFFLLRHFYNKKNVSVIAVSNQVKESLESIGVRKVKVVYNPLLVPSEDDEKIPFELPESYFVFVGRLSYQKAPWKLLKGFARFHHSDKENVHLVIVGDGELKPELERLSADLHIQDLVHFTGFVKKPMGIIKNAYCMVFSSYYEGFPITVLESFLYGVPVIGSRVALPNEIRAQLPSDDFYYDNTEPTENFDATVFEKDDYRLAEIMTQAIEKPDFLKRITLIGNKWVSENCGLDNFKLYE